MPSKGSLSFTKLKKSLLSFKASVCYTTKVKKELMEAKMGKYSNVKPEAKVIPFAQNGDYFYQKASALIESGIYIKRENGCNALKR